MHLFAGHGHLPAQSPERPGNLRSVFEKLETGLEHRDMSESVMHAYRRRSCLRAGDGRQILPDNLSADSQRFTTTSGLSSQPSAR